MPHAPRGRPSTLRTAARSGARLAGALAIASALVATAPQPAGATAPDSVFVAVGGLADSNPSCATGRSATTSDSGTTWPTTATPLTAISQPPAPCTEGGELYDVARSGSTWLAVGTKNLANGNTQGVIFRSTDDGSSWAQVGAIPPTPPGVVALEAIATNGTGRWAAGGYHGLWYSDDQGATWSPGVVTFPTFNGPFQIHDIAERPGTVESWQAVGSTDLPPPARRKAMTRSSTNGLWWDTGSVGLSSPLDIQLNGVAIDANGTAMAVGSSHDPSDPPGRFGPVAMVMPSTANTWNGFDPANQYDTARGGLNAVAVGAGGRWIAVGTKNLGTLDAVAYRVTSPVPGGTWSANLSASLPTGTDALDGVETDRFGTWVAVGGDRGSASRSIDDGGTWTSEVQTIPASAGRGLMRRVAVRPGTNDPWTT